MLKLNKKILSTYIILYSVFGNQEFNLGEALRVLSLFESKKSAISDIKHLHKMGFLKKTNSFTYSVKEPYTALKEYLKEYIASRIRRRLKSLSLKAEVKVNSKITVKVKNETLFIKIPQNPLITFQEP